METETSVAEVKKTSKVNGLTIFLIVLLLTVIGLGIWGVILNTNLKSTDSAQAALQKKFDTLTEETNTLTVDLEKAGGDLKKAKSDLEKAKKDLATAQSDLTKSTDSVVVDKANIEKALKYLDIAVGLFIEEDSISQMKDRVETVNDPILTEKFNTYFNSGNETDFSNWLAYLFVTISDLLK